MYRIKLDDACTVFSLYRNNELLGVDSLVGQHLLTIANAHGIDISRCESDSHILAVIQQYQTVEIE
jgi:hypothetical protein